MLKNSRAIRFLVSRPHHRKLLRFALVSIISVSVSLVLLTLVFGYLHLWSEVPSSLFANVLAGIPAYFLTRQWVWQRSGRSHLWSEVVPFWVISLASIVLALAFASLAHNTAVSHDLSHVQRTILVIAANLFVFGFLWVLRFLLFNHIFSPRFDSTSENYATYPVTESESWYDSRSFETGNLAITDQSMHDGH